jgi:hypothetical protein
MCDSQHHGADFRVAGGAKCVDCAALSVRALYDGKLLLLYGAECDTRRHRKRRCATDRGECTLRFYGGVVAGESGSKIGRYNIYGRVGCLIERNPTPYFPMRIKRRFNISPSMSVFRRLVVRTKVEKSASQYFMVPDFFASAFTFSLLVANNLASARLASRIAFNGV